MSLINPHADMLEVDRQLAGEKHPGRFGTALRNALDRAKEFIMTIPIPEAVMREEGPVLVRRHPRKTPGELLRESADKTMKDILD